MFNEIYTNAQVGDYQEYHSCLRPHALSARTVSGISTPWCRLSLTIGDMIPTGMRKISTFVGGKENSKFSINATRIACISISEKRHLETEDQPSATPVENKLLTQCSRAVQRLRLSWFPSVRYATMNL
jgi:hypothetical protein